LAANRGQIESLDLPLLQGVLGGGSDVETPPPRPSLAGDGGHPPGARDRRCRLQEGEICA